MSEQQLGSNDGETETRSFAVLTSNQSLDRGELPFLVTNWVASYSLEGTTDPAIVNRLRSAAAELASVFAEAGVFGSVVQPSFETRRHSENSRNATFSDMRRRWASSCPPDQLERLLGAVAASNLASDSSATRPPNLLTLGAETRIEQIRNPKTGRTLQDAIEVENGESQTLSHPELDQPLVSTALQPPVLLAVGKAENKPAETVQQLGSVCPLNLLSSFEIAAKNASSLARTFIDLRDRLNSQEDQLRRLNRSMQHQKNVMAQLQGGDNRITMPTNGHNRNSKDLITAEMTATGEREESKQNCLRVIAQLDRQLLSLGEQHQKEKAELSRVEKHARIAYDTFAIALRKFRDPFGPGRSGPGIQTNHIQHNIMGRQIGLGPMGPGQHHASRGLLGCALSTSDLRRKLLFRRLSHGATINTHLSYPIYCLRFDRTGRYFVTGADDYLAKLYCLGANVYAKRGCMDRESYMRGAVLVCTLRGHAGVINDINVSHDNAFLATASEDGDCRVWGLKDGSPIAILRGHAGGANMVSWSPLTPYRLITAASDGYARVWDIKDACLRRYKAVVGKRQDYSTQKPAESPRGIVKPNDHVAVAIDAQPLTSNLMENGGDGSLRTIPEESAEVVVQQEPAVGPVPLPPLPPPAMNAAVGPVPLPPLPPSGGDPGQQPIAELSDQALSGNAAQAVMAPPLQGGNEPGRFVAGDSMDKGVKLVAKLQHGATRGNESMVGAGTRSRRAAVKVLCVAICPTGGHFTTGADDGICRVFSASDDKALEVADSEACDHAGIYFAHACHQRNKRKSSSRLLLTLKGHLSAITDLQYSYAGDRILSASQRDGVFRIWSWNIGSATGESDDPSLSSPSCSSKSSQVSHIVVKLTNPNSSKIDQNQGQSSRRRPNKSPETNVSCDVAAWVRDDKCIVTSQCQLVKQTSSEIVPGSQYIFLWDSQTGQCLLGISGGHSMQAAVIVPHPTDPTLVLSAGADGKANIWDLQSGRRVFSHKNTVEFGPIESRDRGQISTYLDASFSPDGVHLVLTDDSGRVTVLDCGSNSPKPGQQPCWMREQYFANDYYDLLYDPDGYCIERGSEQPPHLAPRGVRCSHSGASWGELINNAFKSLTGPLPVPEHDIRWERIIRRLKGSSSREKRIQRGNIVGQYDPSTTALVSASGHPIAGSKLVPETSVGLSIPRADSPPPPRPSPALSRDYRWSDFNDILEAERQAEQHGLTYEEERLDSDDDSFRLETRNTSQRTGTRGTGASRRINVANEDAEEDSESDSRIELEDSPAPRRKRKPCNDKEEMSEDEGFVQIGSTNNTPTGPFVADYDSHYFKVKEEWDIGRQWLLREESNSSYDGRKSYAPQVGDSVVYIPRAHHETMNEFPSLVPPWQSWPDEAEWPVVRCTIRDIRYRFPYKAYFPRRNAGQKVCGSIVAILTLELTGIPELSGDSSFWPKPCFVEPTKTHTFELGLFESDTIDFVIPLSLYCARLLDLHTVIHREDNPVIEALYAKHDEEDGYLDPFPGRVVGLQQENSLDAPNLRGSGYESVTVIWDEDGSEGHTSPWDLRVPDGPSGQKFERPTLNQGDKRKIRDALKEIHEMGKVKEYFQKPVNVEKYYDYLMRVEVPMHLDRIKTRLEANYYCHPLSVIADVKLIRDNSSKYNGHTDDLTLLANEMLEKFTERLLTSKEYLEYQRFQRQLEQSKLEETPESEENETDQPVGRTKATRQIVFPTHVDGQIQRSSRVTRSGSALESLPAPTAAPRMRLRMSQNTSRQNRSGQDSEEASSLAAPAPVVVLDAGNRGRTSRNSRGQQPNTRQLRSNSHVDTGPAEPIARNAGSGTAAARQLRSRSNHHPEEDRPAGGNSTRLCTPRAMSSTRRTSEQRPSLPQRRHGSGASDDEGDESDTGSDEANASANDASPALTRSRKSLSAGRLSRSQLEDIGSPDSEQSQDESTAAQSENASPIPPRTTRASRARANSKGSDVSYQDQESVGSGDSAQSLDVDDPDESEMVDRKGRGPNGGSSKNGSARNRNGRRFGSPGRKTRRTALTEEVDSDQDASYASTPKGNQGRIVRRSRRTRLSTKKKEAMEDIGSASESEELDCKPAAQRRPKRSKSQAPPRKESGAGRANRRCKEDNDEASYDEPAEREDKPNPRRTRRQSETAPSPGNVGMAKRGRTRRQQNPPQRKGLPMPTPDSPRRAARAVSKSYLEPSSSEFGSDNYDSDEMEVKTGGKRNRASKKAPPADRPVKKQKKVAKDQVDDLLMGKKWPNIEIKEITPVAHAMLALLREKDTQHTFAVPVGEEFPELAEAYSRSVKEPMDFRTIEEQRLPEYKKISQLQNDLKLVFSNCLAFNKGDCELADLARYFLMILDDTFCEACAQCDVILPRRW